MLLVFWSYVIAISVQAGLPNCSRTPMYWPVMEGHSSQVLLGRWISYMYGKFFWFENGKFEIINEIDEIYESAFMCLIVCDLLCCWICWSICLYILYFFDLFVLMYIFNIFLWFLVFCWMRCPLCAVQSTSSYLRAWPRQVLIVAYGFNRRYLHVAWHWPCNIINICDCWICWYVFIGFLIKELGY